MKPTLIQAICARSQANLAALFAVAAEKIEQAMIDSPDGITINHSIKIQSAKNMQTESLAISVRHVEEISAEMPDPFQPDLFQDNDNE